MKVENKKQWSWTIYANNNNKAIHGSSVNITIDPNTGLRDIDKDDWERVRAGLANAVQYNSPREGFLYIVFSNETTKPPGFFESLFGMRR